MRGAWGGGGGGGGGHTAAHLVEALRYKPRSSIPDDVIGFSIELILAAALLW